MPKSLSFRLRPTKLKTNASALKAQLENGQTQEPGDHSKLEEELTAKIDKLQIQLEDAESLLAIRKSKIDELKASTREAEKNADALKAQLEGFQSEGSTSGNMLEEELSRKIDNLEHQLKEGESLLNSRHAEIAELKTKASEADKKADVLKAQLEKDHTAKSAARNKLQEEFNAKIAKLERRLKESETLLGKRDTEIADLTARTHDAEKNGADLKTKLEDDQSKESAAKKKLEEEFNAAIAKLELRLKEGENLLQKRDAEIAQLQTKTQEAEENASVLKAQLERDQTQVRRPKQSG